MITAGPITVDAPADAPVSLVAIGGPGLIGGAGLLGLAGVGLVEVFTGASQRARTSQAAFRSAIGERLRYVGHHVVEHPAAEHPAAGHPAAGRPGAAVAETELVVVQRDPVSGLRVETALLAAGRSVRIVSTVINESDRPVVLTGVSATVGVARHEDELDRLLLASAESEWLAENRWREVPLRDRLPRLGLPIHGQDGRGHAAVSSHGAWSTGEHLPVGVLTDPEAGAAIAWQIESSAAWQWDLAQTRFGAVLSLLGPNDLEHQFARTLAPGAAFTSVPVAIAASDDGRDGAIAELTGYRRRRREYRPVDDGLPLVYNDFMNTLMGQPTTEALEPLIDAAAAAGAECFCIDAGWFADPAIGDWWPTVGEWTIAESRFTHGFAAIIDRIHRHGMRSGIWLEPEVVGVDSPIPDALPDEAFFQRFGERVVEDRRFHLDLRHPAARAHLDDTVDRLVRELGVGYFKLDYNINPGVGTDVDATAPGDGLLGHARAYRDWLSAAQRRHPEVLFENCASGAMRADGALLSVAHLQSTSDQQNWALYPPIAASAPASIPPEQCGNWAYPSAAMTLEETAFTLVTGLSGRLYLAGFLHELADAQLALVHEAVALHRELRAQLASAVPFWPIGLPGWDDEAVALGLRSADAAWLVVWDRSTAAQRLRIPGVSAATAVFPTGLGAWGVEEDPDGIVLTTVDGPSARVFRVAE